MRCLLFILLLPLCSAAVAVAEDFRVGDIMVSQPWARDSAGQTSAGVVYMRLFNFGQEPDALLSIVTPVAARASVHETVRDNNRVSMRSVKRLEITRGSGPSGDSRRVRPTVLEPGGLHIMLMGLTAALEKGQVFTMVLSFERAGPVAVQVEVQGVGAMEVEK